MFAAVRVRSGNYRPNSRLLSVEFPRALHSAIREKRQFQKLAEILLSLLPAFHIACPLPAGEERQFPDSRENRRITSPLSHGNERKRTGLNGRGGTVKQRIAKECEELRDRLSRAGYQQLQETVRYLENLRTRGQIDPGAVGYMVRELGEVLDQATRNKDQDLNRKEHSQTSLNKKGFEMKQSEKCGELKQVLSLAGFPNLATMVGSMDRTAAGPIERCFVGAAYAELQTLLDQAARNEAPSTQPAEQPSVPVGVPVAKSGPVAMLQLCDWNTGDALLIRPDYIGAVTPLAPREDAAEPLSCRTRIDGDMGQVYLVRETPEEILRLMNGGQHGD